MDEDGVELIEMVGHRQIHGKRWSCRLCMLEEGAAYPTYEALAAHLTGSKLTEGGHGYENLILDHDCVYRPLTQPKLIKQEETKNGIAQN